MAKPERHLATLDAMRGIAAFAVCLFHFSYTWPHNLMPHAYLAVDFFFALSGFVIARAYEDRLATGMGTARFMWLRLVRLYPLILLGLLLGLGDEVLKTKLGPSRLMSEALCNILLLPTAFTGWPMFPLNPPTWSLFYELAINLAFAAILRVMPARYLYAVLGLSALWFAGIAFSTQDTGRGPMLDQWQSGTARVTFSFIAGMILHRWEARGVFAKLPHISGIWLCAALLLCMAVKKFPDDWIYDLACVFVIFPLLVGLGGRHGVMPARAVPVSLWLGRMSYPIYVLHYPLLLRNSYHLVHNRHGIMLLAVTVAAMLGVTLLSWAALVLYDEPLRRWLGRPALRRAVPAAN